MIRAARQADAEGIGTVHVRSWQAVYHGHFPQDFLDRLDPAERAKGWRAYLGKEMGERESLLVSEVDGGIAGFASSGPAREGEDDEGEVRAIYLLPEYWGRGLGSELMAASLRELAQAGFTKAMLWVLEANLGARSFYEATGWSLADGARIIEPFGFPIPELRYLIALA
ncbi:MAG: GNAT family N-acetyltransferase [Actinomycetota bacterium]|nr:GNAT family N-acetyltransferase [Actinomycetota bacterium]